MPLPAPAFRARCCDRSRGDVAALAAALERARGRTVPAVDAEGFVVAEGGTRRRVAVRDAPAVPDGADRVLVRDRVGAADPRVTDLDDLHRRLCYAVNRPAARAAVRTHLGVDPAAHADPGGATRAGRRREGTRALAAAGAVCLVVAVAALAGVVPGLSPASGPGPDAGPAAPAAPGGDTATPAPADAVAADRLRTNATFLPGVSAEGTVDARVLSGAHRTALSDRSYTATLSYREFQGDQLVGRYVERLYVVDDTRYASFVAERGTFSREPMRVAGRDVYAAGETEYRRTANGTTRLPVRDGDRFLPATRRYLAWHLAAKVSGVRRAVVGYQLGVTDERYATVPVSGYTTVTGEGVVLALRRTYDLNGSRRAVLSFGVTKVGETTLPPSWRD